MSVWDRGELDVEFDDAVFCLDQLVVGKVPVLLDADAVLAGEVSPATRSTIAKATGANEIAALTLGSPEFQRR